MAVLGFHVVFSLIAFTFFTKFRSRWTGTRSFIYKNLYRFLAPSSKELKEKVPLYITGKSRKRKAVDRESEANGFLVPKNSDIVLTPIPVTDEDVSLLPWYSILFWIVDYLPFSIMVYCSSEAYRYLFPTSTAINISAVWILLSIGFAVQALASMAGTLFSGDAVEGERNLILSFAAVFFLFSMMFTMFAEGFFDIGFNEAYGSFTKTVADFLVDSDLPDAAAKRSPLFLFIILSVMFAFLGAMLVFPNFRYAKMYTNAVNEARPVYKLIYHFVFLSQAFSLLLFIHPVKNYLLYGSRKMLTSPQLDSLRIWSVVAMMVLRVLTRRAHLQSHLNLAIDALDQIRHQTGNINSIELQKTVFRYFSYLNVAALQYFLPTVLTFIFALLLKTLGNLSWNGQETESLTVEASSQSIASLHVILGPAVQRGVWSLLLVVVLLMNFFLSFLGVIYNSYLIKT